MSRIKKWQRDLAAWVINTFGLAKLFNQIKMFWKPISVFRKRYIKKSSLVSFVIGLIFGGLFLYFGLFPKVSHHVLLVGSGTVRSYLITASPELKERVDIGGSDGNVNLLLLEGGTSTGTRLFADAYEQVDMIVMASNKRKLEKDLAQFPDKQPAVFEAFIGRDPLQILLVANDDSTLNNAFADILSKDGGESLELEKLVKKVWDNKTCDNKEPQIPSFDVYASAPQSGTVAEWENRFNNAKNGCGWPSGLLSWEAQSFKVGEVSRPSIFLGSEALNKDAVAKLTHSSSKSRKLFIIGNSGQLETRDLYLYGRVLTNELGSLKGKGYGLPTPVADTLRYIFNKLNAKASNDKYSAGIDPECLKKQIEYFHLDQAISGWVQSHSDGHKKIYQADRCPLHEQK